ncbi:MAG: HEAT repeat domain-containing protein [Candidatus Riflebacteria bacterium]|nr:HEAT repeat domain-containing protein [Candidatus Riflebacteria bacterium]
MDPIEILLEDLKSDDPFIRFSVLSRIETMEWNSDQVNSFQSLLLAETDEVVMFHLQKILAHIEQKFGGNRFNENDIIQEIQDILASPDKDNLGLALVLESVKKSCSEEVTNILRKAGWENFSPEVLPFIIRFFKKFGSAKDVPQLIKLCQHSDPRIVGSAVEALEKLSFEKLQELIVPLLLNPIHGIRSKAVRLLYRWDPKEALRHFEAMLFSEEASEKQAALFHAFFFPFEEIEPLMLKFLSLEKDNTLINKAGLLFRTNPLPDEPAKLAELLESSGGARKKVVEDILKGVVESLHQIGLIDKKTDDYLSDLNRHIKQKKSSQLIDQSREALSSNDSLTRKKAAHNLSELAKCGNSEAVPILKKHLDKESDGQIKSFIEREVVRPDSSVASTEKFETMTPEQRLKCFSGLNAGNLKTIRSSLKNFYTLKPSQEEKLALITAIGRCGQKVDSPILQPFIGEPSPEILAAVIEAFGKIDPDYIFPYLPKFIKHSSDEVRLAAIQAFALFDKRQAISLVEKLGASIQPRQRQMAIFCAAQFDFLSVKDLLFTVLKIETDTDNLRQILALLKANLDEDILFQVFRVKKESDDKKADILQEFLEKNQKAIAEKIPSETPSIKAKPDVSSISTSAIANANVPLPAVTAVKAPNTASASNFQILEKKYAEEVASRQKPLPSYSLKNIQDLRKKKTEELSKNSDTASFVQFCILATATGIMAVALIWYLFISGDTAIRKNAAIKGEFDGSTKNVSGLITYLDTYGRGFLVQESGTNSDYFVFFRTPPTKTYKKGDTFSGQIRPYKRDRKTVLSELINWN